MLTLILMFYTFQVKEQDVEDLKEQILKGSSVNSTGSALDECDSLKFPDFKNNVQEVELSKTSVLYMKVDSIATGFIEEQCGLDSLVCGKIYLKDNRHYLGPSGNHLFLFAYAFEGTEESIGSESANFFVFGIWKNDSLFFWDIASDLLGEVQLALSGIEQKRELIIVWGELYPFFSSAGYGKFKMTLKGQEKEYEFACNAEQH